jgi:lipopolysaccharide/colanic/teichoic acid biosynthesis glycosyltransferase
MHLIGPRAEWTELVKTYEKELPYYNERHLVAPGITGWAQVNYPYGANIEDTKQKLMYDLYYIKYWNLALELKIVWKTAITVISKKGL